MGKDFTTARTVLGFVELICWAGLVAGILIAIAGGGAASRGFGGGPSGLIAALPGLAVSLLSLLAIVAVQGARAQVETAQMTSKILDLTEEHVRLARGGARFEQTSLASARPGTSHGSLSSERGPSGAAPAAASEEVGQASPDGAITYRGQTITPDGVRFLVGDKRMFSVEDAKMLIDHRLGPAAQGDDARMEPRLPLGRDRS